MTSITAHPVATASAAYTEATRLRRDATLDAGQITTGAGALRLKTLPPGVSAALRGLAEGDRTEAATAAAVIAHDGETGLLRWHMLRARLDAMGLLEHCVTGPDGAVAA